MNPARSSLAYSSSLERTEFLIDKCERSLQAYEAEKRQLGIAEKTMNPGIEAFDASVSNDLAAVRQEYARAVNSWRSILGVFQENNLHGIYVGSQETRDEIFNKLVLLGNQLREDTTKIPLEYY